MAVSHVSPEPSKVSDTVWLPVFDECMSRGQSSGGKPVESMEHQEGKRYQTAQCQSERMANSTKYHRKFKGD